METFIFKTEWIDILNDLPQDLQLTAYKAIMNYAATGCNPDDGLVRAITYVMRKDIEKQRVRKQKAAQRRAEKSAAANIPPEIEQEQVPEPEIKQEEPAAIPKPVTFAVPPSITLPQFYILRLHNILYLIILKLNSKSAATAGWIKWKLLLNLADLLFRTKQESATIDGQAVVSTAARKHSHPGGCNRTHRPCVPTQIANYQLITNYTLLITN